MSITKFPAAFTATLLVVPCALAQTETRLCQIDVGAPHAGAKAYTPLITSTGARTAAPLHESAMLEVARRKRILRAQSAMPRDDATYCASSSSLFDMSPVTPLARRAFCQFIME